MIIHTFDTLRSTVSHLNGSHYIYYYKKLNRTYRAYFVFYFRKISLKSTKTSVSTPGFFLAL
jgi:hypothetical protein